MNIGILEKSHFSTKAVKDLELIGTVSFFDGGTLGNYLVNKEVLFIRLGYYIDCEFLDQAPALRYICTPTTGLNHLDLKEINKRKITIVSLKGEDGFMKTIKATPEHTFGLTLALLRKYKVAFLNPANKSWDRDKYRGLEINHQKVGIVGYGRVGKIISNYFQAFGAEVCFYDIDQTIKPIKGAQKANSLKELIKESTIILLCASYSPEHKGFFSKQYINLLKDKYFINTSRGELIDENYLIEKISANQLKGVALDVIADENHQNNLEKLLALTENHNLIITPHIAGATYESMAATEEFVAKKLIERVRNENCAY